MEPGATINHTDYWYGSVDETRSKFADLAAIIKADEYPALLMLPIYTAHYCYQSKIYRVSLRVRRWSHDISNARQRRCRPATDLCPTCFGKL
jgi:hypothetical protein